MCCQTCTRPLTDFRIENSGGEKRLRFTTVIANNGPGPFVTHLQRPNTSTANMTVGQHIYNSEGDFRHVDIDGTHGFWGGDGHSHWHVYKLQRFRIYTDSGGQPGTSKASGAKIGFCFYDNTEYNLNLAGGAAKPGVAGLRRRAPSVDHRDQRRLG